METGSASSSLHAELHEAMTLAESELIALHRRIVQVPSVNFGDGSSAKEDAVAAVMGDYLNGHGISARTAQGAPGRANLLARIPAKSAAKTGDGKTLLLMSHSDVVPVGDESAWRFPPFSAEIADGRIYGRGSNDCKMLVAAELFAVATLARLGLPKRGEIRLAVGADEEAGGKWGFGWLAANEPDFLKADMAINEGGGAFFGRSSAGNPLFLVGCGEKGRYEVTFTAKGPGTHASVPWGKINPLLTIARLAERIAQWQSRPEPVSPIFRQIRRWMELSGETREENLAETIATAERRYSASFRNSLMAQSRLSIVPTLVAGGDKTNVVPSRVALKCDARLLPGQTRADLEKAIDEILSVLNPSETSNLKFEISETAQSSVSPFPAEIEKLFKRALDAAFQPPAPVEVLPTWCTGFTDSRFVRPLGSPTYGFQVIEPRADPDRLSIHCIDESIEVGMLLPCALALGHLALDFCGGA